MKSSTAIRDFESRSCRHAWGHQVQIHNEPASALVDGEMIRGIGNSSLKCCGRGVISNEILASDVFDSTIRLDHQRSV